MITCNRPIYTEKSLSRLCAGAPDNVMITIWDNGSNEETKQVVRNFQSHRRVERIIFNAQNEKLTRPTNWFWENCADADLLGKVDDDCLVPDNWCQVLGHAHSDIRMVGILGCWLFYEQDLNYDAAKRKIRTYGDHQVLRNCWVGGSGYLMKRELIKTFGLLKHGQTFTDYCIRAAAKGYINGWYYPFLFQEHMDDPRSENTVFVNEEEFQKHKPLSAIAFGIETRQQWVQRQIQWARKIQEYSLDPDDYIGVKAWIKRKIVKMKGVEYFPRMK